ncbi:MAG: FadR/GntR family transcriptional regulator [Syntrophobacteraceae bacterium]
MHDTTQSKYRYNQIVENIQRLIGEGELRAGDRLPPERTLAQTFRVSRNCIRQAIQALAEKGFLESRQGDGTYICAPDRSLLVKSLAEAIKTQRDLIEDIIEFRLMLEPQIARLAAKNISDEALDRLKITVCDQERRILAGEPDWDLDAAFHAKLAEASGNMVIRKVFGMIDGILDESRSEFLQSHLRRKSSVAAHLMIINALENKNPEEAFQAMREHLLEVERTIFDQAGAQ